MGDGENPSNSVIYLIKVGIVLALTRVKIRTRNYNRNSPPADPTDWDEPRFAWIFILFMLNWVFSVSTTARDDRKCGANVSVLTVRLLATLA